MGRSARASVGDAGSASDCATSAEATTERAAAGKPVPPESASSAALLEAQALRISHVRRPSVVWCIGQTWPGATPGQQSSSTAAVGERQSATGADAIAAA